MDDDLGPLRGHIRSPRFRRVSHGLFLPVLEDSTERAEWLRDLRAWLEVLPGSAVFTGLTAARLAGWWTPPFASWVPVFVAVDAGDRRPQRVGLLVSRLERGRPEDHRLRLHGLPADRPAEVLLRCARDLDVLDMVPLVESALRAGAVTRRELDEIDGSRRPGVRMLRRAVALADPRSESPWETTLRLFLQAMDLEVEVQPDVLDDDGRFVARADLRLRGTHQLFEYDGATHRSKGSQREDLRRQRRLMAAGQERRGYTADDLLRQPAAVMGEIDRLLGRPAELDRLRRWKALLARSAYTDEGKRRLRSRWAVRMEAFIVG